MQIWISDLATNNLSKTIKNIYGLVSSALEMFSPDRSFQVTLPARKKPELYCPSNDDIKRLLRHIEGTELEIAVLLAAFIPLRRGEICALTASDIHGNIISGSKSKVMDDDDKWHIKQPKTYGSYREIEFPEFVIKKIKGKTGQIIKSTPNQISSKFNTAIEQLGMEHFRFHDLRHYAASTMHAIGVPDQYIL